MTYNVFGGTLSRTQSINHELKQCLIDARYSFKHSVIYDTGDHHHHHPYLHLYLYLWGGQHAVQR